MDRVSPDSPLAQQVQKENSAKDKRREEALERATKLALETVDEMFHTPKDRSEN